MFTLVWLTKINLELHTVLYVGVCVEVENVCDVEKNFFNLVLE